MVRTVPHQPFLNQVQEVQGTGDRDGDQGTGKQLAQ